jgi:hypothetical protein
VRKNYLWTTYYNNSNIREVGNKDGPI